MSDVIKGLLGGCLLTILLVGLGSTGTIMIQSELKVCPSENDIVVGAIKQWQLGEEPVTNVKTKAN